MRPTVLPRPRDLRVAIAVALLLPAVAGAQVPPAAPGAADAGAAPDAAALAAASGAIGELDRITVTATRTERAVVDVPHTVDVIDRERMDALLVRDLRDLFRYEPGITVGEGFGRFGIGDIRIRGLGGNRVRIQTDGIAVPDAFAIGSFSNANRNFVDLDTLRRVEVVRGPASALYGSDALGGVVAFTTKDPGDYLADGGSTAFSAKVGYQGDRDGVFAGATAALGGARWSGLLVAGHREGGEVENRASVGGTGNTRTLPNPQDSDGRSVLAKLVFAPAAGQRLRLTVGGNEDRTRTDVLTARGFQAPTRATNTLVTGDDLQTRARVSLAHELDDLAARFADSLDWQVYRQDSETTQDTREERTLPAPTLADIRERSFNFDQRVHGLQANARRTIDVGGVRHDIAYGLDLSRTATRQKRDGLRTFPLTGVTTPALLPDVFPVRDFPNSTTTQAGLYLQDEMAFAGGDVRLVPGVRIDHYRLEPEIDAIFADDNPGVAARDVCEINVSPKLGAVWHFAPAWSLFGGYTRGFRSPPYNDVNIGFTNLQFGYTAIANPDLRPETSDGLEAGLRFVGDAAYASVSAHYTRYDDFIESLRQVGFDPAQGPFGLVIFQSQNVDAARIYGAEFRAGIDLGALSDAWSGWSLRGAAAWARGKGRGPEFVDNADGTTGEAVRTRALDSVDPLTASLGIAYERGPWGMELAARVAGGKPEASVADAYRQRGYGVFDLYAHWTPAAGVRFDVGVRNLVDRRYSTAGSVPSLLPAASTTLDRYTSPGRNLAASVSWSW